jgi:predicted ABC-type ATPase
MKFGFLICGPSGTGKSSHVTEMLKNANITQKFLLIDPDKLEGEHSEQSKKALELVYEQIEKNKNFVYIATCGGMKIINTILKKMKEKKMKSIVAIPYVKLSTALERLKKRRDQPVPEEVVKDLHEFFTTKAERYMNLELDQVYLYNNETDFNLIYSKTKDKIKCTRGEFFFDISKYC